MKCLKSIPFLLLLILGSCAPKVRTQISKNYDPLKESEQVIIFGLGESIPEGAEALGSLKYPIQVLQRIAIMMWC